MKILYVNWAPLWRGAEVGGGVNLYSQSMAVKLAQLGHNLFSISSGFAYDLKNRAYIKKGPDFMGVKNYEIFNAPNIAPGFFNYENPMQDVSEPVVEKLFDEFINHIKPDVVHFQNIEGFSVKCIDIAVKNGCRTIFSLHNYHPVCNQIYLLYKDKTICQDFDNGRKCLDCINPPPYSKEIIKRRAAFHIHRLPFGDRIWRRGQRAAGLVRGVLIGKQNDNQKISDNQPADNQLLNKQISKDLLSDNRHILYAKRRKMIIEGLNRAHKIHAVSEFVRNFYIKQGIKPEIVTTCHIGNKMAEIGDKMGKISSDNRNISQIAALEPKQTDDTKPLNIVFLGISSQPKGLPFLLETLLGIDKYGDNNPKANQQTLTAAKDSLSVLKGSSIKGSSILKQINLHIHARGVWSLSHLIKRISEQLNHIEIHDGYAFNNLPDILSGMNYGVVPPLWYDNAPQVVFEMMAMKVPVIGADIGGIPDFVKDMDNGILFKPGDKIDLASKISMVVNNRELESKFRKNIAPMKTPDQHAQELEEFYIKL